MESTHLDVTVAGVQLRIALLAREGSGIPLFILHGFGSTKESFADMFFRPEFRGRPVFVYDAPGSGCTGADRLQDLSISALESVAHAVAAHLSLERVHLVGHSMGGLTALLVAESEPGFAVSFTNIEGNLDAVDCFLSRQAHLYPTDDCADFLKGLRDRVRGFPTYSSALYAAGLEAKVRPASVPPLFRSIVHHSTNGDLLRRFIALPSRKMFVYGSMNDPLPYLDELERSDVRVTKIPHSGHFPMYANPDALWSCMGRFLADVERDTPHA